MTKVVANISMSLDGYVTGPDPDVEHGLGHGGEPIHEWVFDGDPVDTEVLREATESSGAVIMGRKLFDTIDAPTGWTDEMGYGAGHAAQPPFFVVTHEPPASVRLPLDFTFVTGGVAAAITTARERCPDGLDVVLMGGGDVIAQALDQGLLDELCVHVSPIVVGSGAPLFGGVALRELRQVAVQVSPSAVHVTYAVADGVTAATDGHTSSST